MRTAASKLCLCLSLAGLLALLTPGAYAQFSSSIEATVLDSTGAAVSSAHAVAENQDTHVKQTATTNESGYLRFQQMPPGKYTVKIEASGFQKWIQRDIDRKRLV